MTCVSTVFHVRQHSHVADGSLSWSDEGSASFPEPQLPAGRPPCYMPDPRTMWPLEVVYTASCHRYPFLPSQSHLRK